MTKHLQVVMLSRDIQPIPQPRFFYLHGTGDGYIYIYIP
jgi:hypothetical protein